MQCERRLQSFPVKNVGNVLEQSSVAFRLAPLYCIKVFWGFLSVLTLRSVTTDILQPYLARYLWVYPATISWRHYINIVDILCNMKFKLFMLIYFILSFDFQTESIVKIFCELPPGLRKSWLGNVGSGRAGVEPLVIVLSAEQRPDSRRLRTRQSN